MNIPDAIVDREILELGLEDITGLYAIVWRLHTLYPSCDVAEKYDAADRRVRALLRAGHIRLVRQFIKQEWRVEPVLDADAVVLLRLPVTWYPSDISAELSQVSYESTDSGKQVYSQICQQIGTVASLTSP
jgi:hypothetical protein